MSAAARLYSPQQQQTCWHRPPLNGHGTVLVDVDLNRYGCQKMFLGGRARPVPKDDNLTVDYEPIVEASTSHNPIGLLGLLQGELYFLCKERRWRDRDTGVWVQGTHEIPLRKTVFYALHKLLKNYLGFKFITYNRPELSLCRFEERQRLSCFCA
jgi:hypothetical protein